MTPATLEVGGCRVSCLTNENMSKYKRHHFQGVRLEPESIFHVFFFFLLLDSGEQILNIHTLVLYKSIEIWGFLLL